MAGEASLVPRKERCSDLICNSKMVKIIKMLKTVKMVVKVNMVIIVEIVNNPAVS